MRLPLFTLIGLGALIAAGALVWLVNVVTSLSTITWGAGPFFTTLLTGGRWCAVAIVAAGLVWNKRLPLLVTWIVAGASALASLVALVLALAGIGGSYGDILWLLGFAAAGVMGLLLWLRTAPERPAQQNPWAQPQQAYAAAVQQPWGQQPQAGQPQAAPQPQPTQQMPWGQPTPSTTSPAQHSSQDPSRS